MAHSGSALSASSKAICEARYQNECWYSIARSKCFCASPLHDVSKCTCPSFALSVCPNADCASERLIAAVAAIASDFFILALLRIAPSGSTVGAPWPEVISEKRDFYGSRVLRFKKTGDNGAGSDSRVRTLSAGTAGRPEIRRARGAADAESAGAAVLPRRTPRRGDHEAGIVRRRLARNYGRRRGPRHLHPGAAQSPARRCAQAALHRDAAPARLPLHRQDECRPAFRQ